MIAIATLLLVSLAATAPDPAGGLSRTRLLMGTLLTIEVGAPGPGRASAAVEAAFDTVAALERRFSNWRADSEIARLNASAAAAPFPCSHDLFVAVEAALDAAARTDGASDPTVEPLVQAWDLRGEGREPTRTERDAALARVGWRHVVLDRAAQTVRFAREGVALDLGGIGKGVALERATAVLRERGVSAARLDFGGEIRSFGESRRVAVAHPADRLAPAVSLVPGDAAVSTSGQAERGVTVNRRWHGHVLDPRTGAPVPTRASVTVVAPDAIQSDGLDTGLLVMGREAAGRFAMANPSIGVLWLEPHADVVRAWAWNLPSAATAPGARVEWMHSAGDHP